MSIKNHLHLASYDGQVRRRAAALWEAALLLLGMCAVVLACGVPSSALVPRSLGGSSWLVLASPHSEDIESGLRVLARCVA
jgi:hypothetical protein